MNLEKLIEKKQLEFFDGASDNQIRNKLSRGISYLNRAKKIYSEEESDDRNAFVHSNVYLALQMVSQAYLLSNGYRTKGYGQHKTNIMVCCLLMDDDEMS